jgi:hypothetical protein
MDKQLNQTFFNLRFFILPRPRPCTTFNEFSFILDGEIIVLVLLYINPKKCSRIKQQSIYCERILKKYTGMFDVNTTMLHADSNINRE